MRRLKLVMYKVVSIVGARPQFVKSAVVSRAMKSSRLLCEVIVHTGQHYDHNMSNLFFEELDIPVPDYELTLRRRSHGGMTGEILIEVEEILVNENPDLVLVYGDTNSTLAGTLAASKLHVPVAHVEAGLRSYNKLMPEEQNRIVSDHLSTLLFCPTENSKRNLKAEGVNDGVEVVGDVMLDASKLFSKTLPDTRVQNQVLVTIHRAENVNSPRNMSNIVNALIDLAKFTRVIFPIHPNTRSMLMEYGLYDALDKNISCVEPVGYLEILKMVKESKFVITDSGGLQKEAYFLGKPTVVLRDQTEWTELKEIGAVLLVSPINESTIRTKFKEYIADVPSLDLTFNPYGDGMAASKIVKSIERFVGRVE